MATNYENNKDEDKTREIWLDSFKQFYYVATYLTSQENLARYF